MNEKYDKWKERNVGKIKKLHPNKKTNLKKVYEFMNISYTACKVDVSDSVKLQSDQEKERKGVKEKRELK